MDPNQNQPNNANPEPVVPEQPQWTPPAQPSQTPSEPNTTPEPPAQPQPPVVPNAAPIASFQPQAAVFSGQVNSGPLPPQGNSRSKKKIALISAGAAVFLVLIGLAGFFGLYVPSKPENVFNSGIERTGKVADKMLVAATEKDKLESFKSSELTGSIEVKSDDSTFSGSFGSKYDSNQTNSTVNYKSSGEGDDNQEFAVQFMTDLAQGKVYPDVYFKITGIKSFGLESFAPGVEAYDGKWIGMSSDYIESQVPIELSDKEKQEPFTKDDAAEVARIISATTRDYLFSSDPDKAVLVQKSFVGTEKVEGVRANRYTIGLNQDNARKYCQVLVDKVMSSDAYKRVPGIEVDKIDENKKSAIRDCDKSVDYEIDENDTVDMWIDKRSKLIHKVRFSTKYEPETYVEVGQNYKKGDLIPIFMNFHSDKDKYNAKMELSVDVEKSITKGTFTMETTGDDKYSAKADFEFKPFDGDVKVEKPKDMIPFEEVMKLFGFEEDTTDTPVITQ